MYGSIKLLTGNSNPTLAREVAEYLGVPLTDMLVTRFSDGEVRVQINESLRGEDVFVLQSLCPPANENIMELLLILDAIKRASAGRITAVIPYYAYARQDRKDRPRVPISARLLADLITTAGAQRVVVVDLHSPQIQGFFDIPVDNLYALQVLHQYLQEDAGKDTVVVSPDAGGVERARLLANKLGSSIAIIYKRRPEPNVAEVLDIIGDVEGKRAVIVDDIIDTAGTVCAAAELLLARGATRVDVVATHGIFSGPAVDRLMKSPIQEVVVTNTIPPKDFPKLRVVSVAPLLGEAIKRIHEGESVSSLFT
ncbi:ribose-phosphate pyrophosphokinase [Thermocrinis albus DSM 14484]|uniref:Ribose-phosphate pyrophosphokinase n=1 Tax=Thermocrinis albus (strain DSM 14484 / JCM 11386 / HI 11/12) TaxID=638303 RepID=D3SNW4_THEAH|nr:ribose-phosphate pyrophosphokinase [Thermocrinis albus]ADC88851.1 ribose-phosphate pyrophosphokinase [Thermocrinis albus DSM 14484]